uniref:Acyltransferase 3 domain-containing protein n=1 Tax=Chromera velia CCMP2878 TaxID=1169474 RepID=A0A0G4IAP9_9ALVE|eukprot:Cvel_12610.t1-p1 / transcript=Cvel_12610.t1 / gene=Cvel_12610 / organism=Chromera_velia_CCMP2878 / gene_product=hypothetical protein / transcript_product=hypothetical protein / location=Cvel_scaffold832:34435-36168(-) / protein_length=578 / sequence_SO=supercontig / SO=protein_coding / is_pseudo=false
MSESSSDSGGRRSSVRALEHDFDFGDVVQDELGEKEEEEQRKSESRTSSPHPMEASPHSPSRARLQKRTITALPFARFLAAVHIGLGHFGSTFEEELGPDSLWRRWTDSLKWAHSQVSFFFVLSGFVQVYAVLSKAQSNTQRLPNSQKQSTVGKWLRRLNGVYAAYFVSLIVPMLLLGSLSLSSVGQNKEAKLVHEDETPLEPEYQSWSDAQRDYASRFFRRGAWKDWWNLFCQFFLIKTWWSPWTFFRFPELKGEPYDLNVPGWFLSTLVGIWILFPLLQMLLNSVTEEWMLWGGLGVCFAYTFFAEYVLLPVFGQSGLGSPNFDFHPLCHVNQYLFGMVLAKLFIMKEAAWLGEEGEVETGQMDREGSANVEAGLQTEEERGGERGRGWKTGAAKVARCLLTHLDTLSYALLFCFVLFVPPPADSLLKGGVILPLWGVLIIGLSIGRGVTSALFSLTPLQWLGSFSLCLYLFQMICLALTATLNSTLSSALGKWWKDDALHKFTVFFFFLFLLSILFETFVAQPLNRRLNRKPQTAPTPQETDQTLAASDSSPHRIETQMRNFPGQRLLPEQNAQS